MADAGENIEKHLREITECPICLNAFTDPRILPCIHTFCFQCLIRTSEAAQMRPGDKMPCPLCRKEFIIPADGVNAVQKNFFMENLMRFKTALQMGSASTICDMCNVRNEGNTGQIPKATMRCLECQDNYCDSCVKVHQFQKISSDHQLVEIGSDIKLETKRSFTRIYCRKHNQKPLDYYCADCKKIVCVSCFVESHASHKCKDVNTVDEEFRQTIKRNWSKVLTYAEEMLSLRKNAEIRKADFLKEIIDKENSIHKRNKELKDMIDQHTKSLLDELSVIKSKHLKEMDNQIEEIERCCTIFRSFEVYCNELISNGSASDICSSVDGLIDRTEELEKDHEAFIRRPHQSVEVSFQTADLEAVLEKFNNNAVGKMQATTTQLENYAVVVGLDDGLTIANEVIKINLHRSEEISTQNQIPTTMAFESFAAVYCNTMYVTGIGAKKDEIWKYNTAFGWTKCASLVQGRRRHSAAFIDEVLYICGGCMLLEETVLDSVEAYNAVTDKCTTVGKLVHGVESSGNCVSFGSSLYIFGGIDKDDKNTSDVQVYGVKQNSCTLLSKPMPCSIALMRAVVWETSVILLGHDTCFIFNFETETWHVRQQFKTEVVHFGGVLENDRVFIIGGGICETNKDGKDTWKCTDTVRYVPIRNILEDKPIEWKIHAQLFQLTLVQVCEKLTFIVP